MSCPEVVLLRTHLVKWFVKVFNLVGIFIMAVALEEINNDFMFGSEHFSFK